MTHVSEQGRKALTDIAEWLERGAPHVTIGNGFDVHHFDMEYSVEPDHYSEELNTCGTACCIAGAVCQFNKLGGEAERNKDGGLAFFDLHRWNEEKGEDELLTKGALQLAIEYLGITEDDALKLFVPWDHFDRHYNADEYYGVYSNPKLAAAVVRKFLATGKVDWNIELAEEAVTA